MIALVVILAIACLILYTERRNFTKNLNNANETLDDIYNGNLNQRFHVFTSTNSLLELGGKLNTLLDEFQKILERKNYLEKLRKEMISNISHDLRTPLTSLLGYIEALQKDDTLNESEKKNYLNIIAAKGNGLYSLLQEFFELSKLESDDLTMNFQKINITEKIQDILVGFYQEFTQAAVTPEIHLPDGALYVWGDSISIDRILNNLISNALRYGKAGGVVGIMLYEKPGQIWADIWDQGKGIPPKDLPYVFERLYTSDASRNTQQRGSGLGLTITKKLVEKQNGKIFVTSMSGEKTTFSFYLPKSA